MLNKLNKITTKSSGYRVVSWLCFLAIAIGLTALGVLQQNTTMITGEGGGGQTAQGNFPAIAMEGMIQYGLNQGQVQAERLGYIPLSTEVKAKVASAADQLSPDFTIELVN